MRPGRALKQREDRISRHAIFFGQRGNREKFGFIATADFADLNLGETSGRIQGAFAVGLPARIEGSEFAFDHWEMFPSLAFEDLLDGKDAHTMFIGQCLTADPLDGIAAADFEDLDLGETMVYMTLAFARTPFFYHVCDVVKGGAEKQMVRAHTRRIIAMMADMALVGNWTKSQLPSKAMGEHSLPEKIQDAVPSAVSRTLPFPASVGAADLPPKPIIQPRILEFTHTNSIPTIHITQAQHGGILL